MKHKMFMFSMIRAIEPTIKQANNTERSVERKV